MGKETGQDKDRGKRGTFWLADEDESFFRAAQKLQRKI
jgi:hypothetical protein